jgi:hypothetical protein
MAIVARMDVLNALLALVSTAAGNVVGLKTSSLRMRAIDDVNPTEMPALFLVQGEERYERTPSGALHIPPKRTMDFAIVLYTADNQATSTVPITQLNTMVDAIEAAFAPDATTGAMTLGKVASARLEGTIRYYDNVAQDGKSMAVIPVVVIRP